MSTPRKQKKDSTLLITGELKEDRGRHLVKKDSQREEQWIHLKRAEEKEIDETREGNAELEAFAGDLYRLMIGVRQPKLRATDAGSTISKEIPGFLPFGMTTGPVRPPMTTEEAIHKGIAPALVTSYFLLETDLHLGNIGVNDKDEIVRIDFDNSLSDDSRKKNLFPIFGITQVPLFPSNVFGPMDWMHGWEPCISRLRSNELFQKDKIKYCLKICLLDPRMFNVLGQDHLSQINKAVVTELQDRQQDLQLMLVQDLEFKKYFAKFHSSYWNEIRAEYQQYNDEIQKDIHKLERYIELVTNHPNDYATLPELSKPKYQGLNQEELLEKLHQEKQGYTNHLIDLTKMHQNYRKILNFSPLQDAADLGQVDVVKSILESKNDNLDVNGALEVAVTSNQAAVATVLANSNYPTLNMKKAFEIAVNDGNVEMVKILLASQHSSLAVASRNEDEYEDYNAYGEEAKEEKEISVSNIAAEKGYVDVIKVLRENNRLDNPYEMIQLAAKNGHLNVIQELVLDIDYNETLKSAVKNMQPTVVKGLLMGGLPEEKQSINDMFKKAVKDGLSEIVKVFLESKYEDLDVLNIFNFAATKEYASPPVVEVFLESKQAVLDKQVVNNVFLQAVEKGDPQIVETFLRSSHQNDLDIPSALQKTTNSEIKELLISGPRVVFHPPNQTPHSSV